MTEIQEFMESDETPEVVDLWCLLVACKNTIEYAIKQTHYGGCNGGLSESECQVVHDCLIQGVQDE